MNVYLKWTFANVIFLLFGGAMAHAQNVHGVLRVVKGDVQIKSAKTGQTAKARLGEQVYPKDVVLTGKDARAKIVMVDNNEINVSPESQIEIQHYEYDPKAGKKDVLLNVIYGKVRSKVEQKYDGKTTKFLIKTPSAVAGVRGTDFLTSFDRRNNSSQITTFQGKVEFGTPGPGGTIANPVFVVPGMQATSMGGAPPTPPAPVPKEQLAKMDKDTKTDTSTPAKPPAGDRAPASEKKENKEDKKEDGKKADNAGGAKGGAGAPVAGGSSGAREPASTDGGGNAAGPASGAAPAPGGCMMCDKGPDGPLPPPPLISTAPVPVIMPPPIFTPPPCEFCNLQIQNGKANLSIRINTN